MDSGEVGLEKQSAEEQEKTGKYSRVLQETMKFRCSDPGNRQKRTGKKVF